MGVGNAFCSSQEAPGGNERAGRDPDEQPAQPRALSPEGPGRRRRGGAGARPARGHSTAARPAHLTPQSSLPSKQQTHRGCDRQSGGSAFRARLRWARPSLAVEGCPAPCRPRRRVQSDACGPEAAGALRPRGHQAVRSLEPDSAAGGPGRGTVKPRSASAGPTGQTRGRGLARQPRVPGLGPAEGRGPGRPGVGTRVPSASRSRRPAVWGPRCHTRTPPQHAVHPARGVAHCLETPVGPWPGVAVSLNVAPDPRRKAGFGPRSGHRVQVALSPGGWPCRPPVQTAGRRGGRQPYTEGGGQRESGRRARL